MNEMTIELKPHHWGCTWCKKEFPKGKVPKHMIQGMDLFNPSAGLHEWVCEGAGKPAVEWCQKQTSSGQLYGMVRKDWKPKHNKKIS